MADPRFFKVAGPFRVEEIAGLTGCALAGTAEPGRLLHDVAPLETAEPAHLSFLANRRYGAAFRASRAGAAFVTATAAGQAPAGMALLVGPDPYRAFAIAAQAFYPRVTPPPGIAGSAVIEDGVILGDGVSIGHNAVVEAGAEIGAATRIGSNTTVGPGVRIGRDCTIAANVTLTHCLIGDRVIVHPGVCIGQDGFGFASGPEGHVKIPQIGRVVIGDDVEIGANTTIDRGAGPDTVVGSGTMIDNLVQIGHNVVLGRGCVLVAQSGISGSTRLGDFVVVGGQVGVTGHLSVGAGARLAGKSGVMRDVPAGATMGGVPAVPMVQWLRQSAILDRLANKKDK